MTTHRRAIHRASLCSMIDHNLDAIVVFPGHLKLGAGTANNIEVLMRIDALPVGKDPSDSTMRRCEMPAHPARLP